MHAPRDMGQGHLDSRNTTTAKLIRNVNQDDDHLLAAFAKPY